jgi:hypothetical protein
VLLMLRTANLRRGHDPSRDIRSILPFLKHFADYLGVGWRLFADLFPGRQRIEDALLRAGAQLHSNGVPMLKVPDSREFVHPD